MRSHEGICRRVSFGQRRRRRRMPGRRGACRRSRWCRGGTERKTAAGSCGTDRQRLRDRVHRQNAEGLKGLSGRRPAGPAPRLSPAQKAEPARMVREGPDLAADGVVRWRRAGPLSAGSKRAPAPPWTSAGWASSWPRPDFAGCRCARSTRNLIPRRRRRSEKPRRDRNRCPAGSRPRQTFGRCGSRSSPWCRHRSRAHGGRTGRPAGHAQPHPGPARQSPRRAPRYPPHLTWACMSGTVCPERRATAPVMPGAGIAAMNARLRRDFPHHRRGRTPFPCSAAPDGMARRP